MSQKLNATIYRQLFTDCEWDAISSAMKDYADYGDEEATIADSIDAKISAIFNLTAWLFPYSIKQMQRELMTKKQIFSWLKKCENGAELLSVIDNLRFNGFIK